MIQDPGDELFGLSQRAGDTPGDADRRAVALIQRRFGLALPPPFAAVPSPGSAVPVRVAGAVDVAAIASVRWRSWQVAYRGLIPDAVLEDVPTRPPLSWWTSEATVPPTTRHDLLVAGRVGVVLGMAQVRPTHDQDQDPAVVAEINKLYLDPLARRLGVGRRLLDEAVTRAWAAGAERCSLWAVVQNEPARAFYEAVGWRGDGLVQAVDLGAGATMEETRYWLDGPG